MGQGAGGTLKIFLFLFYFSKLENVGKGEDFLNFRVSWTFWILCVQSSQETYPVVQRPAHLRGPGGFFTSLIIMGEGIIMLELGETPLKCSRQAPMVTCLLNFIYILFCRAFDFCRILTFSKQSGAHFVCLFFLFFFIFTASFINKINDRGELNPKQ